MTSPNGRIHAEANVVALAPATEPVKTLVMPDNTRNDSRPAADVYRAICQVAKEISRDGIAKARRNEQQGYGFRGVDDIMNALSALLAGADLIILPRMLSRVQDERATAAGKILFYVTVQADFDFVSARDGSCHTVTMYGEAMDSADKATNKAMSAAWKYACLQVFCIPTEGMADADATTPQLGPKPKPLPPAAEPRIDIGNNPPNSRAAQQYVAAQKIATGNLEPARTFETMRDRIGKTMSAADRGFQAMRERVGEDTFLAELARYGWHCFLDVRKALTAAGPALEIAKTNVADCYWRMEDCAIREGK